MERTRLSKDLIHRLARSIPSRRSVHAVVRTGTLGSVLNSPKRVREEGSIRSRMPGSRGRPRYIKSCSPLGFHRSRSGATAVEFGLLALPAIGTLAGVLSIGFNFLCATSLDHAVTMTARAVSTGAVSSSGMSVTALRTNVICPVLMIGINCNNVFVRISTITSGNFPSSYYSMVNSNKSGLIPPTLSDSTNAFCPGAGSQYVVVELAYPVPVLAGFLTGSSATTYNGTAVNVIVAASTFLSEPYSGASSYAGC